MGSGVVLDFWLPRPPDNANNRGHWRLGNVAKRRYWEELSRRRGWMPSPPGALSLTSPATLDHTWYYDGYRRKALDEENAIRRLKPIVDWLGGAGLPRQRQSAAPTTRAL